MSYYKSGIGHIVVTRQPRQSKISGEEKPSSFSWVSVALFAGGGIALWLALRTKVQPETNQDIRAAIRARGLDPEKFGI